MLPTISIERDKLSGNYSMSIITAISTDENVAIYANIKCKAINTDRVIVEKDGTESEIAAYTVIIAVGLNPRAAIVDSLWNCAPNFKPIGVCSSPRFIADATNEGYFAGFFFIN